MSRPALVKYIYAAEGRLKFDQTVALIMEYDYQDFSVCGWLRNQNGGYLGDSIIDFSKKCLPEFDADVEDEIYGLRQDENGEEEVWKP